MGNGQSRINSIKGRVGMMLSIDIVARDGRGEVQPTTMKTRNKRRKGEKGVWHIHEHDARNGGDVGTREENGGRADKRIVRHDQLQEDVHVHGAERQRSCGRRECTRVSHHGGK